MNLSLVSILIILRLFGLGRSDNCIDCQNYGTILTCDPQTCDRQLLNGLWAGNVTDGGEILVGLCPPGYCLYNESDQFIQIPHGATQTMGDFLCNDTRRMGILCGQCQPGNAPSINSGAAGFASDCVPCDGQSSKINWVYYLLAIYAPLLVVFLVIIVFNIRLTTGPMNSFILFAQVISSTLDINQQGAAPLNVVYGKGTTAFQKSYQIPYNLFNLNLFGNLLPPFCLHENMSSSDVLVLRYAEGFFPVLIIVVILLLLRCQRCSKVSARLSSFCGPHHRIYRIGTSLVHAFAAFVLLSYNRLCQTTVFLLAPVALLNPFLKAVDERIFFQGEYQVWDSYYVVHYKLPAYLVTVLLIAAPFALFHYPVKWVERLVSKVNCLRNVYPSASIAILLDTFQGCYKDNRRYFAGLYLALRLLLFYAYLLPTFMSTLLVQQVIIIVYIFLLSVLKPYKDNRLNILDVVIFTNMALINILSWYTIDTSFQTDLASLSACIIIESILVFLPMVYFVAILLWYCTRRCHEGASAKMKNWSDTVKKRLHSRAGEEEGFTMRPPLSSFSERSDFYTVFELVPLERETS
eukprot:Em0003g688a